MTFNTQLPMPLPRYPDPACASPHSPPPVGLQGLNLSKQTIDPLRGCEEIADNSVLVISHCHHCCFIYRDQWDLLSTKLLCYYWYSRTV